MARRQRLTWLFLVYRNHGFLVAVQELLIRALLRHPRIGDHGAILWESLFRKQFFPNSGERNELVYRLWYRRARRLSKNSVSTSTTEQPLISILIPIYKPQFELLTKAIESVTAQISSNYELILIDDGNNSCELSRFLRQHAEQPKISILENNTNLGISRSLNRGAKQAKGKYLLVLDQDDLLEASATLQFERFWIKDPAADVIYGDTILINELGGVYYISFKPDFAPELFLSTQYFVHPVFIRRCAWDAVDGCNESFGSVAWDYDLLLRLHQGNKSFKHLPHALYHWRHYSSSTSSLERDKVASENLRALSNTIKAEDSYELGIGFNQYRKRATNNQSASLSIIVLVPSSLTAIRHAAIRNSIDRRDNTEIIFVAPTKQPAYFDSTDSQSWLTHQTTCFASALNAAIEISQHEIVIFCNTDQQIEPNSLSAFCDFAKNKEIGVVASTLLRKDGGVFQAGLALGFSNNYQSPFAGYLHTTPNPQYLTSPTVIRNITICGAFGMALRREIFEQVNGFDPRYGNSLFAQNLCLEVAKLKFRNVLTPFARIHYSDDSSINYWHPAPSYRERFYFNREWSTAIKQGDPLYHPALSRTDSGYHPSPFGRFEL